MTRENLHSLIESNSPFTITMADGTEYYVPHHDFISVTAKETAVVVSIGDDQIHVLPLITMTGISQDVAVPEGQTIPAPHL